MQPFCSPKRTNKAEKRLKEWVKGMQERSRKNERSYERLKLKSLWRVTSPFDSQSGRVRENTGN